MRIGYARVSTLDQDNTAQIKALNAAGYSRRRRRRAVGTVQN
jgi:DNA invertase Pin-like site-specific DNA recombinase